MKDAAPASTKQADTMLDHLIEHLRAKDVALDGQERSVAILWTDPKAEWKPLIPLLQTRIEELLVLGRYDPETRHGPAIWLRCVVDRTLDTPSLPEGTTPILYLPGVGRQELRAGQECPSEFLPIVELMFRGTLWLQHNGSDWGVTTFLTSTKTLGLDIARDEATIQALLRALPEVAVVPLSQLSGKRLEAEDFDLLLSGDVIRDLLRWMGDREGTRARLGQNGWDAFCNQCRDRLAFDPSLEADVTAGERMGQAEGAWSDVWERFCEAPASYGDIAGLLRRSRPSGEIPFDRERWPDLNDQDEEAVRKGLKQLPELPHAQACDLVMKLEKDHGLRRSWVWARLDLAPMAQVLEPLSRLASAARTVLGGTTPDDVAAAYLERGWQADAAAWEAIAATPTNDEPLVSAAVRHLLQPWLEESATAFQKAAKGKPLPKPSDQGTIKAGDDMCLLFADGLRYDLGHRLGERLQGRGCRVTVQHRWAAVPTVTATAKPAVTPVANKIVGRALGKDFAPEMKSLSKLATVQNLRKAMQEKGYQVIEPGSMEWPESQPARGWIEAGEIDSLGHKLEARLARQIDEELTRLTERVIRLLDAGWAAVRVITDHGWLLLPGGLPKVDLPKHLTESRWRRCAVIAGESDPEVMRVNWYWNPAQSFATAPGISCFNQSSAYAHGGLSIQECLIPDILVERGEDTRKAASITSLAWHGMRCLIEASTEGGGVTADLRLERASGRSVAAAPKPVDEDGSVSLLVGDDQYEHRELVAVLLDEDGNVLAQKTTRVGAES